MLAVEAIGASTSGASALIPTLPTYMLRLGLTDRVDLGFRVANLTSVGADVKVNLVRGAFDLAIDPSLQGLYVGAGDASVGLMWMNLPLVLGFNLSNNFTLLATPGISYGVYFAGDSGVRGDRTTYSVGGFAGRFGIGANIRLNQAFAIQPEVTALYNFNAEGVVYTVGLGFSFGGQPDYSDIR
jgi:hypothetical protein